MLENLERELNSQKEKNAELQSLVDKLHDEQREKMITTARTIQDLKQKIRVSNNEINQLSQREAREARDTKPKLRVRPKSGLDLSRQHNKSAILLNTIKRDVAEISSFLTVKIHYIQG